MRVFDSGRNSDNPERIARVEYFLLARYAVGDGMAGTEREPHVPTSARSRPTLSASIKPRPLSQA